MTTSQFLAGLIGPVFLTVAIGMLVMRDQFEAMVKDAAHNQPLIFIAGILAMVAGLAIVRTHNIWVWDWRVVITAFGWLAVIGGIVRILFFSQVATIQESIGRNELGLTVGSVAALLVGAFLTAKGYGLFGI